MEFGEKLQALRKRRGLTQEELAEILYVSRTAVSKWESGRGYPNIDSLKEIARYFSVTVDELLSGEKLLSIAEEENRANIRNVCGLLFGMTDIFSFLLIALPLYPKPVDGYIYAVSLLAYTEATAVNRAVYWTVFLALVLVGIVKVLLMQAKPGASARWITGCSVALGTAAVVFPALAGESYAVAVAFLLLLVKGMLLFRAVKAGD